MQRVEALNPSDETFAWTPVRKEFAKRIETILADESIAAADPASAALMLLEAYRQVHKFGQRPLATGMVEEVVATFLYGAAKRRPYELALTGSGQMNTRMFLLALLFSVALCGCGDAPATSQTASTLPVVTPPTPAVTSPIYVELPSGWRARKPTVATVRQTADYPELKAHFTLAIQPRAEFKNQFMAWAEASKKATAEQTKLTNRTETALKQGRIGDHSVIKSTHGKRTRLSGTVSRDNAADGRMVL